MVTMPASSNSSLRSFDAHLARVHAEPVEQVERVAHQRAARHRQAELLEAHRPSPTRAMCSRSTFMAQPQAGRSRPYRPSRSS